MAAPTIANIRNGMAYAKQAAISITNKAMQTPPVLTVSSADRVLLAKSVTEMGGADLTRVVMVADLPLITLSTIGTVNASIGLAAGVYSLSCTGAGRIWEFNDAMGFASVSLPGDAWLRLRLAKHGGNAQWDKLVALVRDGVEPNAPYVAFTVFSDGRYAIESRVARGARAVNCFGEGKLFTGATFPLPLLVFREGGNILFATSADGASYALLASIQLPGMPSAMQFGFACAGDAQIAAKVDNLSYGVGPVTQILVRGDSVGNFAPSLVPNFSAQAISSTQIQLNWGTATDPDGSISGYRARVNGVPQPTYGSTVHTAVIGNLTPSVPGTPSVYSVNIAAFDNQNAEGPQTVAAQITMPEVGASASYPMLPVGAPNNANGGRRDFFRHPFNSGAWENVSLGDQAQYRYAKMEGIRDLADCQQLETNVPGVRSGYHWKRQGFDYGDYGFQPVAHCLEIYCENDPTAPLKNLRDHTYNPNIADDINKKAIATGGVVSQVRVSNAFGIPAALDDGIASFPRSDGHTCDGVGYVCIPTPGGEVLAYLDSPSFFLKTTDIAGDGMGEGNGVTGIDNRAGVLAPGHLIPVDQGGLGSPLFCIALNMHPFDLASSPGPNTENRLWPCIAYGSGHPHAPVDFLNEFQNAGWDNPDRFTSFNRYGCKYALRPDFDMNLLQTIPAKLLAQAFRDFGARARDTGNQCPLVVYGQKTATTSFKQAFADFYHFAFDGGTSLYTKASQTFRNRHGWSDVPTGPGAAMQVAFIDDVDLILRNFYVVINDGPIGATNGGMNESAQIGNFGNGVGGGGVRRVADAPT